MLTDKEFAKLAKNLTAYYMGELIPPYRAVRGFYDREAWECCDCARMYAENHECIECWVEPSTIYGEDDLAAHVTFYCGNGEFFKAVQYWPAESVAMFTEPEVKPIVINK